MIRVKKLEAIMCGGYDNFTNYASKRIVKVDLNTL
jgi:hypothetical protein